MVFIIVLSLFVYWFLCLMAAFFIMEMPDQDEKTKLFKIAFVVFSFISIPLVIILLPFSILFKTPTDENN